VLAAAGGGGTAFELERAELLGEPRRP
jgi:hypothetical protein